MRSLLVLAIALIGFPLVAAVGPTDVYVGADPIASIDAWQDPYDPDSTMSCVAPMTLQVQRNGGGTWDTLIRGVDGVVSPFAATGSPGGLMGSASNCSTFLLPTMSFTNMVGSPATGLTKTIDSSTCYYEGAQVSPFTIGGPAYLSYYRVYQKACYGTGYYFAIGVGPLAMG